MSATGTTGLVRMFRSRAGPTSGFAAPVAISALLIWRHQVFAGTTHGHVAAVVVVIVAGFAMHASIASALRAERDDARQGRRWSSAGADASILESTALPAVATAILPLATALLVLGASTSSPGAPGTFAGATFLMLSLMIALGLAAAGAIRAPDLTPVATLLVVVAVLAVATWVGATGTDDLTTLKRSLPGGAATELAMTAWDGAVVAADVPLMVGPTLGWVVASALVASRCFGQQARR